MQTQNVPHKILFHSLQQYFYEFKPQYIFSFSDIWEIYRP